MSLDVLIAVAGTLVTLLVVVGMIFITPSNVERSNRAAPPGPLPEPGPRSARDSLRPAERV